MQYNRQFDQVGNNTTVVVIGNGGPQQQQMGYAPQSGGYVQPQYQAPAANYAQQQQYEAPPLQKYEDQYTAPVARAVSDVEDPLIPAQHQY